MISLRYGTVYIIVLPTGPYKDSPYVHGLSSFAVEFVVCGIWDLGSGGASMVKSESL